MATTSQRPTDADLLALPRVGKHEVLEGVVRVRPASWAHEEIVARIIYELSAHVRANRLGTVLGSNTLYCLPGGNQRAPDVSFVAAGRLQQAGAGPFPQLAPDLAVEILSPGQSPRAVGDAVGEYLAAGVRLVWVIDPAKRCAASYRSLTDVQHAELGGYLDGHDVLPGLRCALQDLLPTPGLEQFGPEPGPDRER